MQCKQFPDFCAPEVLHRRFDSANQESLVHAFPLRPHQRCPVRRDAECGIRWSRPALATGANGFWFEPCLTAINPKARPRLENEELGPMERTHYEVNVRRHEDQFEALH